MPRILLELTVYSSTIAYSVLMYLLLNWRHKQEKHKIQPEETVQPWLKMEDYPHA